MVKDNPFSDIEKKVQMGLGLDVFNDPLGRKLLQLYRRGILDQWSAGQIVGRVANGQRKEAARNIPFKPPRLNSGELILGADTNRTPIKSHVQYFNAGSLLVANTGSGKTTLVCFYATQIVHHVEGMWLVDLRKKEFRLLRSEFARRGIDLIVIRSRKFKINPLQVPYCTDPHEYASTIADVLVKVLNLPLRASVLLSSAIIKLYEKFGVFRGSTKFPTLFHLFEGVRLDKNANSQARQAVLDNLEAVLLALGVEMLGYYRGWPVHELAKRRIVFELAGQPEAGKDLVLNYLVASEFISRISRGISNEGMNLWMSIDEGQRLFSQKKESVGHGGNSLTDLAGLVRGTGTGLSISVLTPDDLSGKIPSITSTKIMGRCGSIPEYEAAGRFMGLSKEQVFWCAHHLVPGMFVGQVAEGAWRFPFLFRVPKMKKMRRVSDIEADESIKALEGLDVEAVEFSDWSAVPSVTVTGDKDSGNRLDQYGESELRLIEAVVCHPMLASSQYVKLAKISPNTLSKLRPLLIEKGLIREHVMDSAGRGRSKKMWEPLEAAKRLVEEMKARV